MKGKEPPGENPDERLRKEVKAALQLVKKAEDYCDTLLIRLKGKKMASLCVEQAKILKPKLMAVKKVLAQEDTSKATLRAKKEGEAYLKELASLKKYAAPHLKSSEVK